MKGMKISKLINILWWIAAVWPACVKAQEFRKVAQPEAVYGELRKNSEKVSSIQADFTEMRHASYLKEPQKSSGSFVYERKDKMRWEQKTPGSYIILIDGSSLRVSEDGKEKNVKQAGGIAGMVREMLLMIVNGDYQSGKGFEKELFQDVSSYLLVMTPVERRLRQRYDKLEMQFSRHTMGLKQLTFFEKGGDRQVMVFRNEKINGPVDPSVFKQF